MDRNVLNDIVNILCANIEKVHGVIITNGGVITNAYGMNIWIILFLNIKILNP